MTPLDFYAGLAVGVLATFGFNVIGNILLVLVLRHFLRMSAHEAE